MRVVKSSFPKGQPNLKQRCKRFATASTSTQVAVLPWRYDGDGHHQLVTRFGVIRGKYNERFGWICWKKNEKLDRNAYGIVIYFDVDRAEILYF